MISYGETADDILVTCRRSPNAPAGEQVQVLVRREDSAEPLSNWDTTGLSRHVQLGLYALGPRHAEQILPTGFDEILSQTMHPYSHIVWGALWTGIAADAVNRARALCPCKLARRRARRRSRRFAWPKSTNCCRKCGTTSTASPRNTATCWPAARPRPCTALVFRSAPTTSSSRARSGSSRSSAGR